MPTLPIWNNYCLCIQEHNSQHPKCKIPNHPILCTFTFTSPFLPRHKTVPLYHLHHLPDPGSEETMDMAPNLAYMTFLAASQCTNEEADYETVRPWYTSNPRVCRPLDSFSYSPQDVLSLKLTFIQTKYTISILFVQLSFATKLIFVRECKTILLYICWLQLNRSSSEKVSPMIRLGEGDDFSQTTCST